MMSEPTYFYQGEWNGETHDVWKVPIEYLTRDDWQENSQYLGTYTTEQIKNGEHRKDAT